MRCTRPFFRVPVAQDDFINFKIFQNQDSAKAHCNAFNLDWSRVQMIPCGKCLSCRKQQAFEWSMRFSTDYDILGKIGCFLTLTYDDDHLPVDDQGRGILKKDDLQRFFKRCRSRGLYFRYLACGEYGSKGMRPHYHCLFAGEDFSQDSRPVPGSKSRESDLLDELWPFGHTYLGDISTKSINYVSGYVLKRAIGDQIWLQGRPPEFRLMSSRPALGRLALERDSASIDRTGRWSTPAGTSTPPRYYFNSVLDPAEKYLQQGINEQRRLATAEKTRKAGLSFDEDNLQRDAALLRGYKPR